MTRRPSPETSPDSKITFRRRQIIGSLGTAGSIAIAGCTSTNDNANTNSDGSDQTDGADDTETSNVVDETLNLNASANFAEVDLNFANQSASPRFEVFMFEWPVVLNTKTAEVKAGILEDWSIEGTTMTLEMRDGYTWHNGDRVTADDLITQLKIARLLGGGRRLGNAEGIIKDTESIRKAGDLSIEATLESELNETLAVSELFVSGGLGNMVFYTPKKVFGQFTEALAEATTDSEREDIQSQIVNFQWSGEEAYGMGPFELSDTTAQTAILNLYEDHPLSDNINFSRVEYTKAKGSEVVPALRNNRLDRGYAPMTQENVNSIPDNYHLDQIVQPGGPAVIPNHQHELYGRTKVKKALAHVIDNEQVATNFGAARANARSPTFDALPQGAEEQFISSSLEEGLTTYDSNEEAESLLKEEGFTLEDGNWYKPNGDRWSLDLKSFTVTNFAAPTRTIADQLEQFGIDATANIIDKTTFMSNLPEGEYSIAVEFGGGGWAPNPYFSFRRNMVGFGGASMEYPETVEAPPVGEPNANLQTYNIQDTLAAARSASSEDAFLDAIQTLVWLQNQTLPTLRVFDFQQTIAYNTNGWDWPSNGDEFGWMVLMGTPAHLTREGQVQAMGE